jgi:hypothetical protein
MASLRVRVVAFADCLSGQGPAVASRIKTKKKKQKTNTNGGETA